MPTLSVCGNCRNRCAKCGNSTNASHPVWVCVGCNSKFNGKCCSCGGRKQGNVGAGKVCNSCHKTNTCTICGKKTC